MNVGDVVRLKSDGVPMTVSYLAGSSLDIDDKNVIVPVGSVAVMWMGEEDILDCAIIPEACLDLVDGVG